MAFVDGGLQDDSFIENASRVLVRSCHEVSCSPYEVRQLDRRVYNFYLILWILEVERTKEVTLPPTQKPTYRIEPARTKEEPGSSVQQLPMPPPPATPHPTLNPTPYPTPMPIAKVDPPLSAKDKIAPIPSATLIELEGNRAFQRSSLANLVCIISLNTILIRA